jgi:hypothetical protein
MEEKRCANNKEEKPQNNHGRKRISQYLGLFRGRQRFFVINPIKS